jgi:hypothetical protein
MTMSKSVTCKQVAAYPGCPLAPPLVTRGSIPLEDGNLSPVYKLDCRAANASTRMPFWSNES